MTARPGPPPVQVPHDGGLRRTAWIEDFGERWFVDLGVIALIVFAFGAVRPLSDPDLPMHLSVGEWIIRHRALPFVEPFAWTREGASYFAYSWLPQTLFYLVMDAFGPVGLHVLHGLVVLAGACSAMILGRTIGLRPSQRVIFAGMHVIVGEVFVPLLRPQSVLLIALPLIWSAFLSLARDRRVWSASALLFASSAVTACSHLFFPITLAPAVLLFVYAGVRARPAITGIVSVIAGWFVSPYSSRWVDVFRHNFAANPLFRPPSAIAELQPGFVAMLRPASGAVLALAAVLLSVPWVLGGVQLTKRERMMAGSYWCIGLVLFGYATRLFVAWWLLALLPVGWTVARLTRDTTTRPPRTSVRIVGLLACLVILASALARNQTEWSAEGDTTDRTLPTIGARATEPLARILATRLHVGSRARVLTTFANGSYLTWRLPGISASIDSRGVFPDSVSAAEAVVLASDRDVPLGPWHSAEAAVIPVRFRIAEVLDTASGWRRIASAPGIPVARDSVALWARSSWWDANAAPAAVP